MNIKKKHHYVWKQYLKSWCHEKENIFTFKKSDGKIISPSLIGIAQQRYFYSLEEFTIDEEENLEKFVRIFSRSNLLESNLKMFELFTSYSKFKRLGIENEINNQVISIIKNNIFEDFHSEIESLGKNILKTKSLEDLLFLDEGNEEFYTIFYLCIQYLRTNKKKNKLESNNHLLNNIIPKYNNFLVYLYAQNLAFGILENDIKYLLLENYSDTEFITSDQPIINLSNDVNNIELYYPLNPKIAIKIHLKKQQKKYESLKLNEEKVNELNKLIYKNAEEFVFSKSENIIKKYVN